VQTLERVVRAASRDESRPVLTGVLIQFEPGRLTMAATDSYRLAMKEAPLEDGAPEALEAIVPHRALNELQRLVGGTTGDLQVSIQPNGVAFGVDDVWLTSRRIDGTFPNFRSLVPDTFEHEIVVPRGEFHDIVRRVGVFARHTAPLRLRFAEGETRVAAQTPDVGEARESLPTPVSGEPIEIGFNADYLRDGVETVAGDDLRIRLINPLRPALLRGVDDDFWYLLMPIRLS
jgi:DNA polymerase-3 subunit beta